MIEMNFCQKSALIRVRKLARLTAFSRMRLFGNDVEKLIVAVRIRFCLNFVFAR